MKKQHVHLEEKEQQSIMPYQALSTDPDPTDTPKPDGGNANSGEEEDEDDKPWENIFK